MTPSKVRLQNFRNMPVDLGTLWSSDRRDRFDLLPIEIASFAQILRQPPGLAADRSNRQWRFLKGNAFDGFFQLGGNLAVLSGVRPFLASGRCETVFRPPPRPPSAGGHPPGEVEAGGTDQGRVS